MLAAPSFACHVALTTPFIAIAKDSVRKRGQINPGFPLDMVTAVVAGGLFAVAFPLTMISSIFVAPQLMPDWLGAVAAWNPISSTVAATRDLFGTPVGAGDSWVEQHALLMAGVWPAVLTLVFFPLAARKFAALGR